MVAKSKRGNQYVYKLFALNLADGSKLSEVSIQGEVNGAGFGSTSGKIRFDPMIHPGFRNRENHGEEFGEGAGLRSGMGVMTV